MLLVDVSILFLLFALEFRLDLFFLVRQVFSAYVYITPDCGL